MHTILPLGCSLQSTTLGYLLAALNAPDIYDYIAHPCLPLDCIRVVERDALIAVTTAARPLLRAAIKTAAAEFATDIALVRIGAATGDAVAVTVDLALGAVSVVPWIENNLSLWADDRSVWLVPQTFGPAVSVSDEGFRVEIVPPYTSLAERTQGIARAANDIARLAFPTGAAA